MTKDDASHDKLQWHPAFLQAIQMELIDYREHLEFRHEYQLNAAPLQIDLLIIKKPKGLAIDKNIARIFRTDNVVEYKSPEDYLSVKDFWKVCAYANFYAAATSGVDLADVTLTFVENRRPRKLLSYLTGERGYRVEETSSGIYLVLGDYLPIQIIESQRLPQDENLWLESLRGGLKESRLNAIVEQAEKQARGSNLDAYLDVILRANPKTYMEVCKMKAPTLEALVMDSVIGPRLIERGRTQGLEQGLEQGRTQGLEQGRTQGLEQGRTQGLEQGREKTARNLLAMSMPIEDIAKVTELPIEKIRAIAL